jgi:AcrR family transcriptional regulator
MVVLTSLERGMNNHSVAVSIASAEETVKEPAKRAAILDAALRLFVERTYDGTAMPLVAESAGVGAGTIYRYFDSKEALVNAVYRRCQASLTYRIIDTAPKDVPTRDIFHHIWWGLCEFAREEPEASAFLEMHHHDLYLEQESLEGRKRIRKMARDVIKEGQVRGEIRMAPPFLLGFLVTGAYIGLLKAVGESAEVLTDEKIALTEECVWKMLEAHA